MEMDGTIRSGIHGGAGMPGAHAGELAGAGVGTPGVGMLVGVGTVGLILGALLVIKDLCMWSENTPEEVWFAEGELQEVLQPPEQVVRHLAE